REPRLPDFAAVHDELRRHKHVTLQLLWQEYKEANPDGYQYSRFCELYKRWVGKLDLILRQDYRVGEKMFVDHAGPTVSIIDRETGQVHEAVIFVAVLGASNYTYAEATWNRRALPGRIGPVQMAQSVVFTSASPCSFDGGDVDFIHRHHCLKGTFCLRPA